MNVLGIIAIVVAVISLIFSCASLIVTYQTLKDWDKIRGLNRRLENLEKETSNRDQGNV